MFQLLVFCTLVHLLGGEVSYGPLLCGLAIRTGGGSRAGVTAGAGPLVKVIPVFLHHGRRCLGLIAAINVGFNLLAPWLLIAYVLFVPYDHRRRRSSVRGPNGSASSRRRPRTAR